MVGLFKSIIGVFFSVRTDSCAHIGSRARHNCCVILISQRTHFNSSVGSGYLCHLDALTLFDVASTSCYAAYDKYAVIETAPGAD